MKAADGLSIACDTAHGFWHESHNILERTPCRLKQRPTEFCVHMTLSQMTGKRQISIPPHRLAVIVSES